ncbi:MAG: hypothetical protein HY302_04175 [Opitutae bacterium]|nr:hypothetical protein [Opitutae bacterium]
MKFSSMMMMATLLVSAAASEPQENAAPENKRELSVGRTLDQAWAEVESALGRGTTSYPIVVFKGEIPARLVGQLARALPDCAKKKIPIQIIADKGESALSALSQAAEKQPKAKTRGLHIVISSPNYDAPAFAKLSAKTGIIFHFAKD